MPKTYIFGTTTFFAVAVVAVLKTAANNRMSDMCFKTFYLLCVNILSKSLRPQIAEQHFVP